MLVIPSINHRDQQNAKIHYTITNSCLGLLLVAATDNGLCAVYLGDDDTILEVNLTQAFPNFQIKLDQTSLTTWVNGILAYLDGERLDIYLALDVQGTNFQRLVWEALSAIPYGCTRSYKEIAQTIGNPQAVRAVARACATNPVSLVIPCHRVIRSNGDLGGYRWGWERKYNLLHLEKQQLSQHNSDSSERKCL